MSRIIKMRFILLLPLLAAIAAFASESSKSQSSVNSSIDYQLLLAGGSLKTCSTLSVKNCKDIKRAMLEAKLSDDDVLWQRELLVSPDRIQQILNSPYWRSTDTQLSLKLVTVLNKMLIDSEENRTEMTFSKNTFVDTFRKTRSSMNNGDNVVSISGESLYRQLSDFDWFLMLDYLQYRQYNENKESKREQVFLADSVLPATVDIFSTFVDMAQQVNLKNSTGFKASQSRSSQSKPLIVVLTSSSRDLFDAVDFYLQVFMQAGAEVQWLPIDKALNTAIENNRCHDLVALRGELLGTVNREALYPDLHSYQQSFCEQPQKLVELIEAADGVFINGGVQSLTLDALQSIEIVNTKANSSNKGSKTSINLIQLMKNKMERRALVVGGTSAGTAVQSGGQWMGAIIPMITSGDSYHALKKGAFDQPPSAEGCTKDGSCSMVTDRDLTYRAAGGLGLLPSGIFDTHFSERGRQARLIALMKQSENRFAFGVDETSALLVGFKSSHSASRHFKVIGQHGVWIFENTSLESSRKFESNESRRKIKRGVIKANSHYLSHSDTASIQDDVLAIKFATEKASFVMRQEKLVNDDILYRKNWRDLAFQLALSKREIATGKSKEDNPQFLVELTKGEDFSSAMGIVGEQDSRALVSFKNMNVKIKSQRSD